MATFTNQATLSYNDTVTNSNVAVGEILDVLTMTKTAVSPTYSENNDVTYVISIVNAGSTAFNGLTLTDNLGAYAFETLTLYPLAYKAGSLRYYVNGVLQTSPTVTSEQLLRISGINVPAGGNAIIIYEAEATGFAPRAAAGSITNTATLTAEGLSAPITASETVRVSETPALSISKSLSPTTVTENGRITYTFVIQNNGNTAATASDNAVITDTFSPILSNISVTFNGNPWQAPANYTYNTATGEFETVAGQITVPAATYTRDPVSGSLITTPGISTLTVSGNI